MNNKNTIGPKSFLIKCWIYLIIAKMMVLFALSWLNEKRAKTIALLMINLNLHSFKFQPPDIVDLNRAPWIVRIPFYYMGDNYYSVAIWEPKNPDWRFEVHLGYVKRITLFPDKPYTLERIFYKHEIEAALKRETMLFMLTNLHKK